jgi:mannose-6-phosphate isomerase-like protein (cupin superfamily)
VTKLNRRVVTGLDAEGRSCALFDDAVTKPEGAPPSGAALVWRTEAVPASNAGSTDAGAQPFGFELMKSGSNFMLFCMDPRDEQTFMHATDTIDYAIVLKGQIVLVLETGDVPLGPGDIIVDRGVRHAWRATGSEPALMAVVNIPADPVGAGATI